jgi:hypothetical protein
MTPLRITRITLALVMVLVAVLLAAGCIGDHTMNPGVRNTAVTNPPESPVIATEPVASVTTICPPLTNGSYWIRIDPVGQVRKGDAFRISGTTNIPAGKTLVLEVYDAAFYPHCKCCFDDLLIADVRILKGDNCGNTFSYSFDSINYAPQEYLVTAAYDGNRPVAAPALLFTLLENTTPLVSPDGGSQETGSINTSFALLPLHDVNQGDIQTLSGIRKGTSYAIEYFIREARSESACSPYCKDEKIRGIVHPVMSGPDATRFAIRVDTGNLDPGQYVADLELTCSDASAKGGFNVTPGNTGVE